MPRADTPNDSPVSDDADGPASPHHRESAFEVTSTEPITECARGLTATEALALRLLTRGCHEPYRGYVPRIVRAPGRAGAIARVVKLADLDDHLAHGRPPPSAPPYAWARGRILEHMEVGMALAG